PASKTGPKGRLACLIGACRCNGEPTNARGALLSASGEQLLDLAGEPLVHRLAAELESGSQLARLYAELRRDQAEPLGRLIGSEPPVHLVHRPPDALDEARV